MSTELQLARGLAELQLDIAPQARHTLLAYLALIRKWNRVYNLTAVRDEAGMLTQHLLDSLAIVPHVSARHVLDVGSGAGLPGIPLALAQPQTRVVLLEASEKKAAFLRQAAIELALDNVEVARARVEDWRAPRAFELVVSRAFSDLARFVRLAGRLCAPGGLLAAMKGVYPHAELEKLPAGYRVERVHALHVPGLHAERHLVLLKAA
jgi:16S rRNA (guanine527-N7)-methyltransferase